MPTLQQIQDQAIPRYARVMVEKKCTLCHMQLKRLEGKVVSYYLPYDVIYVQCPCEFNEKFYLSDVRLCTPVEYDGRFVAIGDVVKGDFDEWYEVHGYSWSDGEWVLDSVLRIGNVDSSCCPIHINRISAHDTGLESDDKTEEAIRLLKDRGYKIVKE